MRKLYVLLLLLAGHLLSTAQTIVDVRGTGAGTGTVTWTKDKIYRLNGFIFVNPGQTLTIEAGTVIKGQPGQGSDASALIVARGAKIIAEGTASQPIIFTAASDDVNNISDIPPHTRGQWGGVIILGNARLNTVPAEKQIEGIPTTETRAIYGGTNDEDNSGIFRYVSIRYGGTIIGASNEINGLTLGGVGRGTVVDHVEVIYNADDGVEFFGGTVNTSHIISAFNNDDAFDWDQGYRGSNQFWFSINSAEAGGDRGGELDGADEPELGEPFATPIVYNATLIGRGDGNAAERALTFRANGGGQFHNSIIVDFTRGVDLQYSTAATHSYDRLLKNDLKMKNNIFWNVAANNVNNIFTISATGRTADEVTAATAFVQKYFADSGNQVIDPQFNSISRATDKGLDPRPALAGAAFKDLSKVPTGNSFIKAVSYKGAFSTSPTQWFNGWTLLDQENRLFTVDSKEIVVKDNTGKGKTTWTANNTYFLDGFVFVNSGDTLVIEPGTVIKGLPGQGADASALIVARGGYINAQGTANAPIIFTAQADDVDDPTDIAAHTRGQWGGVILLGNARLNTVPAIKQIEGIPTTEVRASYGGTQDDDNSGIFRYVSIRYGGTIIGASNEINGLTLGGLGSKTTVDHVEVIYNADDGFEWFGGTVNTSHLVSAFNNDDAFDWDQGFRGKGQFWFSINSPEAGGDRGGELDGADEPELGEPFATPEVYNMTLIGRGDNNASERALTFRANGGGQIHNSVILDFTRGVDFQYSTAATHSYDRLVKNDLKLKNNIFWNVASNNPANVFTVSATGRTQAEVAAATAFVQKYFADSANAIQNPKIVSLSRNLNGGLDPRFADVSVYNNLSVSKDPFITKTSYKGAFGPGANGLWIKNWTLLDEEGYLPAQVNPVQLPVANVQIIHNSADLAARLVDIYVNDEKALDDFAFRTATPFLALPAGVPLNIKIGAGTSTGPNNAIVFNTTVTLTEGERYILMATGVLTPATYDASVNNDIAFTVKVFTPARAAAATGNNVDFATYHGSTDAPVVDVVAGGNVILNDLVYGTFANYLSVPAARYTLNVTPGNDNNTVVASFDADLSGLGGGAAMVFASGFLNPVKNQGGADFGLFAALPNGTVVEFPLVVPGQTVLVKDNTGKGKTTWTANNTYILDGFVFVNPGDTLVIEAGTVIKGRSGQGAEASALIVARGGYILANGTAAKPIIFTASSDNVNDPNDIPPHTQGLWGGVIILGRASLNTVPAVKQIEGIPTTETRGEYGGTQDDDNSGVFRYVSIRHGGSIIGASNEINGLTMGGIGNKTTIEFVEVIFNADDGFEWFGGTVNTKWLISAFNGDDAYDYDQGFRGKGQFWFAIQSDAAGSDRGGEYDGADEPELGLPFATPDIYNATFIGRGANVSANRAITYRANGGGEHHNSIFTDFGRGIDFQLSTAATHSYDRLVTGDLKMLKNVFWNVAGNTASNIFTISAASGVPAATTTAANEFVRNYFSQNNAVADPKFVSISREPNNLLDPRVSGGAAYFDLSAEPAGDAFFTDVNFKGAFSPNAIWAKGWSYLDALNYLPVEVAPIDPTAVTGFEEVEGLRVYPNPATDKIVVEARDLKAGSVSISLYDVMGKLVRTADRSASAGNLYTNVDVSGLAPAVYMLKVQQGAKASVVRIVVK